MSSHSFCRIVLFTSILSLVCLPAVTAAQAAHPPHWAYEGKEGPKEWGNLDSTYAACSIGHTQSPIDIKGARKADLPTLKFDYHAVPLNIIDNGHTIQVNYAPGSIIDLYGMPIVNDVQRDGVVIEFERRQVRLSSTLDVDR